MNNDHHAILLRAVSVREFDCSSITSSVEFYDTYTEKFGIDDARELVRQAHSRPVDKDEQTLIVRTEFITLEAQNALLKVLEEPPQSTKFIFVIPAGFTVLSTLASRFNEVAIDGDDSRLVNDTKVFEEFLGQSYKERLASLDQASKKKDTKWQMDIKKGLIEYIKESPRTMKSFTELEYVTRTLLTRGASNKMLLEQAALTLPTRS